MQQLFHEFINHLRKNIYVAFLNNADCSNKFSFDEHPSTSKFLQLPELFEDVFEFFQRSRAGR